MGLSNYERMIQIAEEVFAAKNDPEQLNVDENVIKQLQNLHPAAVTEYNEGKGPVVWVLLIPTTIKLMNKFIKKEITEKQLLDLTPLHSEYDALYLCSVMTLPEYRNKGLTKRLILEAIEKINSSHAIQTLFVWPFTEQGEFLAKAIAAEVSLPLYKRPE